MNCERAALNAKNITKTVPENGVYVLKHGVGSKSTCRKQCFVDRNIINIIFIPQFYFLLTMMTRCIRISGNICNKDGYISLHDVKMASS
jgi:hypothetical protein